MSSLHSEIFRAEYRRLRPRAPIPEAKITFYHFANLNNTIRLREGLVAIRLSDLLEGAPRSVLSAIVHILVAKLYGKPIDSGEAMRYRRYVSSHGVTTKTHLIRQMRGRKKVGTPHGSVYDLEAIFEELNRRFFHGLMGRPQLTWSDRASRQSLGHYDPAHNTIVVSRIFDRPQVPRFVIDYLLYHEMLHLKHPVRLRGSRRCVHSKEFIAEEKLFPGLQEAQAFLKHL